MSENADSNTIKLEHTPATYIDPIGPDELKKYIMATVATSIAKIDNKTDNKKLKDSLLNSSISLCRRAAIIQDIIDMIVAPINHNSGKKKRKIKNTFRSRPL